MGEYTCLDCLHRSVCVLQNTCYLESRDIILYSMCSKFMEIKYPTPPEPK